MDGESDPIWTINGMQLEYSASAGEAARPPTLSEIAWARRDGTLADQLPSLRFSVKALGVRILTTGSHPARIEVGLCASRSGAEIDIPFEAEHLVVESTLFALDTNSMALCRTVLEEVGIANIGQTTLGKLQELLCHELAEALVIDRFELDPGWVPADLDLIPNLRADLYLYQTLGVRFLRGMSDVGVGVLLADEMGLGKTLQVIGLMVCRQGKGPSLVIAPAALLSNWAREIDQFAPTLRTLIHAGGWRGGIAAGFDGFDVVITSYDTAAVDLGLLQVFSWDVVVLDEAQYIKNPKSRRSAAVKAIPRRLGIAISGTPVENTLTDLWSICEFLVPSLLGSRDEFESNTERSGRPGALAGKLAAPVTLRRTVEAVAADLPAKVENVVALDLDSGARDTHSRLFTGAARDLGSLSAERMFCAHADVDFEGFTHAPKVSFVLSMLDEVFRRGEKALVFASFQASLDRLSTAMGDKFPDIYFDVVDGRGATSERQRQVDQFGSIQGAAALLLNPRAAGVGLNITAANHVVHFNPEWNPAVTSQATARAHRRNQEKPVMVHHLFYADTIEETVIGVLDRKRRLIDDVNDEVEGNHRRGQ